MPYNLALDEHRVDKTDLSGEKIFLIAFEETRYVTMNIFRKKNLFKSFVKIELSYMFTINIVSTAENCMEK